jgi:membrane-associated PAP2 superfamily phosphatase
LGTAGAAGCWVGGFCASGFFAALQPVTIAAPKTKAAIQVTSFTGNFILSTLLSLSRLLSENVLKLIPSKKQIPLALAGTVTVAV